MTTIATLLSGGEGVGVGARAAGLRHLWGIECDPAVADVVRANGFDLITADIRDVDPHTLEAPDVLHASPECQNASSAKQDPDAETFEAKETRLDVDIAGCIVHYLEVLQPRVFTLENVFGYRRFQSFRLIMAALNRLGYFTHFANLNAADFGVPQTRRRLILRAVRHGLVPVLPPAERPWRGWYEAIEDLVPSLPASEFAPWQLARLPESLSDSTLFAQGGYDGDIVRVLDREPSFTVTANTNQDGLRAFILSNAATEWGDGLREAGEPVHTVTDQSGGRTRAFIVGGQYAKPQDCEDRPPQMRDEAEPVFVVTAQNKGDWRAWLSHGRVVKMTPRCLARFQSFPDDYVLPDNNRLACAVIGNAVPPLMYREIVAGLAGGS